MPGTKNCKVCGESPIILSAELGVCPACVRDRFKESKPFVEAAHQRSRDKFSLPSIIPDAKEGKRCGQCVNVCKISSGEVGYCGVRKNSDGHVNSVVGRNAIVQPYYDPLPTNCVADWICAANGQDYPKYSYTPGGDNGYKNLAVFYCGCTFNCLYCQNWHYRKSVGERSPVLSPEELAAFVDSKTACICYFGGDPTPQIEHALESSRIALDANKGRVLRICWETNGSMAPKLADKAMEFSLRTGGCVKFDLKAFSKELHIALTGVSNKRTLENFKRLAKRIPERKSPPLLVASTLLVPGYVSVEEVRLIASFIADIDPDIPYALLGFHPDFYMYDLPTTSRRQADAALAAACSAGLTTVRVGNIHLLH